MSSLKLSRMPRWQELSSDPNDALIAQFRREALKNRRSPHLISDRVEYLTNLVKQQRVLDIGVVAHSVEATNDPNWLHGRLAKSANQCVGVDVLPAAIELLRARGYNVRLHDLTESSLPMDFDVIIAGEVIEHLSAPGRMIDSCARMLSPQGILCVTVPNPWYYNIMAKNLLSSSLYVDSADHVTWHDPNSMYELAQRSGLELVKWAGIAAIPPRRALARWGLKVIYQLTRFGLSKELFAKSILYEFIKPQQLNQQHSDA